MIAPAAGAAGAAARLLDGDRADRRRPTRAASAAVSCGATGWEARMAADGERVWLITGASRGLGRAFAEAALATGDAVALAARDLTALEQTAATAPERTLALALDVNDRAAVSAAVARAEQRFGRIDVLINNAGYGLHGAVEELSEDEIRGQMETNFFGALWVTQAVLPVMRRAGSGRVIQVSSAAGAPRDHAGRRLQRQQVRARGNVRVPRARGRSVRDPRDDRRAE
jgi:NAD(P)-dependent dehydrogenase (short-subunit alcohol dehydrogenase family)